MVIQSKNVWIAGQFIPAQIELEGTTIHEIYPYNTKVVDVDYNEDRIIPGIIDIHCHGGWGFDTNEAYPEGLINWAEQLVKEGITSFCPTTVTYSEEQLLKAVANVAKVKEENAYSGAQILGIHFEGPYLNVKNKGAQPEKYCVTPNLEQFKKYQEAAKGNIKVITVACELDEDFALTRYASRNGVAVSIGHSHSTYQDVLMAIANGATSMTHVFNGMTGFSHRELGLAGAAMRINDVFGEIICDGNHVDFNAINILAKTKGKDHLVMIDDALCAKGMPEGIHILGGQPIEVRANGSAYLAGTNTLAGGTLKLNMGIRNLIEDVGLTWDYAINMSSLNPARLLHIDDKKGLLCAGYDADIVVLNKDYQVVQTYCLGKEML